VADIARQFAHRDALVARLDARPGHRFVRAALARHIEVRDRTCSHPGCRRPARKSDKDHTHDHAPARPPPRPQPQQPVDLDDLRLSDTDCLGIGTDIATRARSDVPAR
jgi:hypothetical protein